MTGRPLVSAITIFLNEERFLREAVASVLAQTYANWELLLVDDGSTDGSTDIGLDYARRYPGRVRYLQHEGHQNLGMSAARNLGIRHARGEYIALLDADDVWLPTKLERQVAILDSHPESAMLYGATLYWYSWTGQPQDRSLDHIPDHGVRELTRFEPPSLMTRVYPLGPLPGPCLCSVLIRTDAMRSLGGFEESFSGFYEDQPFFSKVHLSQPVIVSEECLDRYRIHPDSCCARVRDSGRYGSYRQQFLDWLRDYLHARDVTHRGVWEALTTAEREVRRDRDLETSEHLSRILRVACGCEARLEVASSLFEGVRVVIARTVEGSSYDIQLNLFRFRAVAGHRYQLTFSARADAARPIGVGFAQGHAPWSNLGYYERITLTPQWQSCGSSFAVAGDDENARIHFDLAESEISVELSSIRLRDLTTGELMTSAGSDGPLWAPPQSNVAIR